MTIDEAIAILRQHNITGASVTRITGGRALEKELLAQVLDRCEQNEVELKETKRLLKLAVDDITFNAICLNYDTCKVCAERYSISCENKFKWRYADEALKLIGE